MAESIFASTHYLLSIRFGSVHGSRGASGPRRLLFKPNFKTPFQYLLLLIQNAVACVGSEWKAMQVCEACFHFSEGLSKHTAKTPNQTQSEILTFIWEV